MPAGATLDRLDHTPPVPAAALKIRCVRPNANHHLWRNGRLWWVAFTILHDGWRQERVRRSLGTADLEEARRRRDALFEHYRRADRSADDADNASSGWFDRPHGAAPARSSSRAHVSLR